MKRQTDLILLHAPSVYDFRKKSIMFGPTSDLVPSTPIFEMYPIGFLTIANYLEKRGLKVRIINLAYRMFHEPDFDVELFIKRLNPAAFGIDLHWLPHCQGATEIAKIVKKLHPQIPVIMGGFSASYFFRELIEFEQVDFIIRGDSAEEPLYRLMLELKKEIEADFQNRRDRVEIDLKNIPNLVWKKNGKVVVNPIQCISKDLEDIDFDYRIMFEEVLHYHDIRSVVPFCDWFRYPITTIPVVRGCVNNCANCGGSRFAFELFGQRTEPAFRDPGKLVEEIKNIRKYIDSPVFLLGDLNSNGKDYVEEFFRHAKKLESDIQIFFEFFEPPGKWFFDCSAWTFSKVCYEISPDSHDLRVRNAMGKSYTNDELIEDIEYALSKGALRFDIYFMSGLPFQTRESILKTVKFCEDIYVKLNWDSRFMPFISPMAPFMDPGSRMFENPEQFGYRLLARTLRQHIEAITRPSWKYILNYESYSISKDDLVLSTYQAALGLNRLKGMSGSISEKTVFENEQRIKKAMEIMKEIDDILLLENKHLRDEKLMELKENTYHYSLSTVCEKKELEFPFSGRNFKWFEIFKTAFHKK